jgi:hypothetical protein
MGNSRSVASKKTLAKSVYSMATSKAKVTSGSSEEEMEEDDDSDADVGLEKSGVVI